MTAGGFASHESVRGIQDPLCRAQQLSGLRQAGRVIMLSTTRQRGSSRRRGRHAAIAPQCCSAATASNVTQNIHGVKWAVDD